MGEELSMQHQIEVKWATLWLFLAVGLGVNLIAWVKGFFVGLRPGFDPGIKGEDVLKGFLAFLSAEILVVPLALSLFYYLQGSDLPNSLRENPQLKAWVNLIIMAGGFVAVSITYLSMDPSRRQALWGEVRKLWSDHLAMGVAAWFVSYPVVMAFNAAISLVIIHFFSLPAVEQAAVQHVRLAMNSPLLFGMTTLSVVILIPLTEEYLFRGLLQVWLKEKLYSPYLSIALTSLIFAFFHFSTDYGITNIELLSSVFLLSCMLGYIFERQRSLLGSVALHGFFNLISLLLVFQK